MLAHRLAVTLILSALAVACGGVADPSKNTVETFTGTIPVGGEGGLHLFSVAKNGELIITLKSLSPPTGNPVGLSLGRPGAAGTCVVTSQAVATAGLPAMNGPINKGDYCVVLQDIGGLTQAEAYVMTVSRP